jgi:hypothetical protein
MTGLVVLLAMFAVIGAAIAFLISYEEMSHHFHSRRTILLEATRTSIATLLFFSTLIAVILAVLPHN